MARQGITFEQSPPSLMRWQVRVSSPPSGQCASGWATPAARTPSQASGRVA
jgi:hypothetical protein